MTHDRETHHRQTVAALRHVQAQLEHVVLPRIEMLQRATVPAIPLVGALPGLGARFALDRLHADVSASSELLKSLLVPWHLPLDMWRNGVRWTEVRAGLSGIAGDLTVTNREVHLTWHGAAADAYHAVLPAHAAAAAQLATGADSLQAANNWAGQIAATFYVSLLAATTRILSALLVGLASALAGPIGVAVAVIRIVATGSLIEELASISTATVDALGRSRVWAGEVLSELSNYSALPAGQWPKANTRWYNDATVTDLDADWSVKP